MSGPAEMIIASPGLMLNKLFKSKSSSILMNFSNVLSEGVVDSRYHKKIFHFKFHNYNPHKLDLLCFCF